MKNLFYSFVIVSVVILALFAISQLSTAQNKNEANTESENQKGLQKTDLAKTNSSDNIWTQVAINNLGQSRLSDSATDTPSATLLTQFVQQGPKLAGMGAVGSARQGVSVSVSADGNTAIVGGLIDNGHAGAAWVLTRSGGVWTQQGPKLVGSGAGGCAEQGTSVSLSADGNTAIVGGPGDNSNAGAAWVWTRSGGVWTQQGTKLVGSGAVGAAQQGISVALSADGNTAIVGGHVTTTVASAGAAWVWTRSGGVWTQQGPKLVGSGAVGSADQGSSVSLSADGNTAIVGGLGDNSTTPGPRGSGRRSGGVWTQQGTKLVGSGAVGSRITRQFRVPLRRRQHGPRRRVMRQQSTLGPRGSGRGAAASGPSRAPSWSARAPWGTLDKAIPCPSPPTATRPSSEGSATTVALGRRGSGRGAAESGPSRAPSWSARAPWEPRNKALRVPLRRRQHGPRRRVARQQSSWSRVGLHQPESSSDAYGDDASSLECLANQFCDERLDQPERSGDAGLLRVGNGPHVEFVHRHKSG